MHYSIRFRVTYNHNTYDMRGLLDDAKQGKLWIFEPCSSVEFMWNGDLVLVHGCFCHTQCSRDSTSSFHLLNFTCSQCSRISQEDDFRKKVTRENFAVEKKS